MSWKSRSACILLFLTLVWGLCLSLANPERAEACVYTGIPVVEFSASSYPGTENSLATITVTLYYCGGTTDSPVTVEYKTTNGTATAPSDYATATGTLTFPIGTGSGSQTFQVAINKDLLNESDETVQLTLFNLSANATFGTRTTATLTIGDVPASLTLAPGTAAICSGGISSDPHQVTLTATLTDGTDPFVGETISFSTNKGSLDTASGVTDANGEAKVILTSNGKASEDPLTYVATVTASAGAGPAANSEVEFQAPEVSLALAPSEIRAGEISGLTATVSWAGKGVANHALSWRISRIWDVEGTLVYNGAGSLPPNYGSILSGASTQTDASGEGTATYQAGLLSGTIELEVADTSVQKMSSGDNPKANSSVAVPAPKVMFEYSSYETVESGKTILVTVILDIYPQESVKVDYATMSTGSAVEGTDYEGKAGTLSFAIGQMVQSFEVTVYDNTKVDGARSFEVHLSNPKKALLGEPNVATLPILDDDAEYNLNVTTAKSAIAAGGKETSVHQTKVTAVLTNSGGFPVSSETVYFSTDAGTLDSSSITTDIAGKAEVVLTSSDVGSEPPDRSIANVTAFAPTYSTSRSVEIEFLPPTFAPVLSKDPIKPEESATVSVYLTVGGSPVPEHAIGWKISRIWDDMNELIFDGSGSLPEDYGSLEDGPSAETDAGGYHYVKYKAGTKSGIIEFEASDLTVMRKVSLDHPTILVHLMVNPNATPDPVVVVTNNDRQGDAVVVANDQGVPGGEKLILANVKPKGSTVMLKIERIPGMGSAGSATFKDTGTDSIMVTGADDATKVIILGGQTSDKPQNVGVKDPSGKYVFKLTVFRVEITPFVSNTTPSTVIPEKAKARGGAGPETLRDLYDSQHPKQVFNYHLDEKGVYGGIYLQGKILPKDVAAGDFAKPKDGRGFDQYRVRSARHFANGKLFALPALADYVQGESDDPDNLDEDTDAGADIAGDTHLYLHVVDLVKRGADTWDANTKVRFRFNAEESFYYDKGLCSKKSPWYFAFSGDIDGSKAYKRVTTYEPTDNNVGTTNLPHLTQDLMAPAGTGPSTTGFEVVGEMAAKIELGKTKAIKINGANLRAAPPESTHVVLFYTDVSANVKNSRRLDILSPVVSADGTSISATLAVPEGATKGKYKLQVFVGGHPPAEIVDALEIH